MDQLQPALIVHGSWSEGVFFIWAETSQRTSGAPASDSGAVGACPPQHPYAATPDSLLGMLEQFALTGGWTTSMPPAERIMFLPSSEERPRLPLWLVTTETEPDTPPHLAPWQVSGLALDLFSAFDLLVALPDGRVSQHRFGADLRYWALVAKLGLEFLVNHKYLPGLDKQANLYRAIWLPIIHDPADRARLRTLAQSMPPICRAMFPAHTQPQPQDAIAPHTLLDDFLKTWIDRAVRQWGADHLDRRRKAPAGIAGIWWSALWREDGAIDVPVTQQHDLAHLFEAWQTWIGQLYGAAEEAFRVCFRLEPPQIDDETGQVTAPSWTLRYLLQANDDPSLLVQAEQVWSARGSNLRTLNRKFEGAQEKLLAGLGLAARLFPPILDSLRTACPQACALTVDDAYAFLREVGPLLEGSGFGVLVPPWWNKPGTKLGVRAKLQADASIIGKGILNMDALVQFDWELALGDQPLTREELERLAALKMPLVRVRGQWVMLQTDEIEAAIAFWEKKRQQDAMRLHDALSMALGAHTSIDDLPLQGVETSGWLEDLMKQLQAGEQVEELSPPRGFVGTLRPYQVRGYSWLAFLRKWGLGGCLADDMGLGKTIQAIALWLHERETAARSPLQTGSDVAPVPQHAPADHDRLSPQMNDRVAPALLLCPTSVVGNWRREIERFAPDLRVMVHHGSARAQGSDFVSRACQHDVIISTYGLARRDVKTLSQVKWGDIILDEAQNVKNPHAKQTQAIRGLPADNRFALTGTPVENRLSELWSIMNLLNPGLLGSQTAFRQQFALPIERYRDQDATARLKGLIGPFILRRVKTDPTIIQDLPDKLEMKVYCNLTEEQTTLYEAVVQESLEQINEAEGESIERRGIVLGALMRLKQVCNHPAHFLGDNSTLPGRSGKVNRLDEMLEEALEVGDKALIFTQFAEMGHMLQRHLAELFAEQVLFLHGGTPQMQRDRMVARFQQPTGGPPLFILSLKAGGTGLNLTAANHVFHFDRWWNPAVENQATDRAFRIGQTRDVQVHKFICAGTLEERIDMLIESKKELAESVISTGEGWLTELSTDELCDLMTLRQE